MRVPLISSSFLRADQTAPCSTLTHRLLLRVLGYFETQLQVLETRDMTLNDMLRWFSQTLDNVRARHRKLLRFGK